MIPDFDELREEIKHKRKKLGWSQRDLAEKTGVSKSLVGKMERGDNAPSYENMIEIYETVKEGWRNEKEEKATAEGFVNEDIVSVEPDDSLKKVARVMKENDFTQLPVEDEEGYEGLIVSNQVMHIEGRKKVRDLEYKYLHIVSSNTSREALAGLLNDGNRAVLVEEEGEVTGIITPADLL